MGNMIQKKTEQYKMLFSLFITDEKHPIGTFHRNQKPILQTFYY